MPLEMSIAIFSRRRNSSCTWVWCSKRYIDPRGKYSVMMDKCGAVLHIPISNTTFGWRTLFIMLTSVLNSAIVSSFIAWSVNTFTAIVVPLQWHLYTSPARQSMNRSADTQPQKQCR